MAQKIGIPKGTRDFTPLQMRRRNYIFDTIRSVFKLHSYMPIETPAMENLSTLMGKYGQEGDKLLFKILNSGDYFNKIDFTAEDFKNSNTADLSVKLLNNISEKGLRYDLTVPFARFVVQHQNEIVFPFKRYQMQAVWRADRPQRGRYREFYQCDADIVGSNSLIHEAEMAEMVDEIFQKFGIDVEVKINNRKILFGIAQTIGHEDKIIDITVGIDKLDKIGLENVKNELIAKGIEEGALDKLQPILELGGSFTEKIDVISEFLKDSEVGLKGVEEIKCVFKMLDSMCLSVKYSLDLTLARGLNYYTGAIFEVKALNVSMGSISGGGRYDDLTGVFGLKGVSGVGISFGADRIYDVIEELNLFPTDTLCSTKLLFVNFGQDSIIDLLPIVKTFRQEGVACEIYPHEAKMQKQFAYADNLNIPYVAVVGETELKENKISLKDMQTGEQQLLSKEEILCIIKGEFFLDSLKINNIK